MERAERTRRRRGRWSWVAVAVAAAAPALSSVTGGDVWPSFRGRHAAGVADGQGLPERWSGESGEGIRWRTAIPGLAHSSPVVWGDRVFLTTAVSSRPDATFRHGLYGDGTASDDLSEQRWQVLALDRATGEVVWQRTAHAGAPRSKRHIKATYANSTPVTDGRHVIAFFGSEGLYAYSFDGEPLWQRDLGVLNAGAYNFPVFEWGTASSPIIYGDLVIVQCDVQEQSFLLAVEVATGKTVWKTLRDELPSWGSPTVWEGEVPELVTNGSNFIRGYDPSTGAELWRLGGSSKITAPTPVWFEDLIVIASGRRPEKPLFVVRAGARGDITLTGGATSSDRVVWSKRGRGPYMPTPLIYRGLLYVCGNRGDLVVYELRTGRERYRRNLDHRGGGFSASPVAADGRVYLPSEDGDIFEVEAGPEFELLAVHAMGERVMATPAIAGGSMFVRGERHLFAVGRR